MTPLQTRLSRDGRIIVSFSAVTLDAEGSCRIRSALETPYQAASQRWCPIASLYSTHVVFPIFLGGMIYLLWRSTTLYLSHWAQLLMSAEQVSNLRAASEPLRAALPVWFLYSLPDGLWVYAVTACMSLIWRGRSGKLKYAWLSSGAILAVGGEIMQSFGIIQGTFDLNDFVFYLAGAGLAVVLTGSRKRNRHVPN